MDEEMDKQLTEQFRDPGAEKRSLLFWAWNGKMDEREIRSQIRQLKEAGAGGFFIHSRVGLETEYLGPEWMNCVRAAVSEAKEQGLYAWLYDEDRWPSGTAGGRVTARGDAYRLKGLTLEVRAAEDYPALYENEIRARSGDVKAAPRPGNGYERDLSASEPEEGKAAPRPESGYEGDPSAPGPEDVKAAPRSGSGDEGDTSALRPEDGKAAPRSGSGYEGDPSASGAADDRLGLSAAYAAVVSGNDVVRYRRLALREKEPFDADEVLLVVRLEVSAPSEWFNDQAPPDDLNPDCVRAFIKETHEKYKEAVGDEFGKTVPGIFTDEPSLNDRFAYFGEHKSWIPWTFGFGACFEEKTGYDFLDVCPLFYFNGENSAKVRHDYWCVVTQRYSESYFQTLGRWCEENHLLFTGHCLQEDKLGLCTRVNGAVMPIYQYMHMPGVDMLCEQTGEYMTVKQCSSVARQMGRKHVLTETYGCTGWEFPFEGQKWIGDWQFVLGVNRRSQHLMLYSLRGCRKRDYPPSFNYQTTWWKENKITEDYFARLTTVLERGDAVRTILLLHPASTAWSRLGVDPYGNPRRREERDVPPLNEYGDRFNGLIEFLERRHLDVDLGDELLIRKYGRAEHGVFLVGNAGYQAVVLPPVDTILGTTCEKLLDLMEQGGRVYAMSPGPFRIGGGSPDDRYRKLVSHEHWIPVASWEELAEALEPYRTIRIEEEAGKECGDILYQMRKDGEDRYLFLVNNNRGREANVTVKLPFLADPLRMDPRSGEISGWTDHENGADGLTLRLRMEKTGSALFCLRERGREVRTFSGPFDYRLSQENVLPLDFCRYWMEEENGTRAAEWSGEQEVWRAQKTIREKLGMRPIFHNGTVQRYKWIGTPHPQDGRLVFLEFSFTALRPFEGVSLALERPECFRVFLNGEEVPWKTEGWFLDREIPKCVLPGIRRGRNTLVLRCAYRNDMELETIYLTGRFGVDEARRLTDPPQKMPSGDWTKHGLMHYCGNVVYLMEYETGEAFPADENVWLKLPRTDAACVKVRVNGHERLLPWNFEQDIPIGAWLRPGTNRIEVEVESSPRNALGPFHIREKPYNTNGASFCPDEAEFTKDYLLAPYGIGGAVRVVREIPPDGREENGGAR